MAANFEGFKNCPRFYILTMFLYLYSLGTSIQIYNSIDFGRFYLTEVPSHYRGQMIKNRITDTTIIGFHLVISRLGPTKTIN